MPHCNSQSLSFEMARKGLECLARANFGEAAGWGRFIRQPDNAETSRLNLQGWFARPLWVSAELQFAEMYIDDRARWVGCPNTPDAYIVRCHGQAFRFRDYARAVRFAYIRALKANRNTDRRAAQ